MLSPLCLTVQCDAKVSRESRCRSSLVVRLSTWFADKAQVVAEARESAPGWFIATHGEKVVCPGCVPALIASLEARRAAEAKPISGRPAIADAVAPNPPVLREGESPAGIERTGKLSTGEVH